MANPVRGEATLMVGAVAYTLALDFNCLCSLEDRFDLPVSEILSRLAGVVRASFIRAVLHVALARHHPDLTEDDVGDLLADCGVPAAVLVVCTAVQDAFPAASKGAGADAAKGPRKARRARAGTGKPAS